MIKQNLKLKDEDETIPGLRESFEEIHEEAINLCIQFDGILDVATSDINVHVINVNRKQAEQIANTYNKPLKKRQVSSRAWELF